MTTVRLALIGFGKWGRNYVQAAQDSGEAEIVQVMKRGDVLQNVHAIVYAGHPSGAAEAVEMAMLVQRPILVEKPAGLSLADAERIAAAEAVPSRHGLPCSAFVLVGHQHLFAEQYEWMRERREGIAHALAASHGPTTRDYPALWDYGPHAVSMLLGLGITPGANWTAGVFPEKHARVATIPKSGSIMSYDGYAPAEPALTRQVRAFARAVRAGGTDDYRFGARWAVDVARILEAASPT